MGTLVYSSLRKVDSENETIQLKSRLGLIKYNLSYLSYVLNALRATAHGKSRGPGFGYLLRPL